MGIKYAILGLFLLVMAGMANATDNRVGNAIPEDSPLHSLLIKQVLTKYLDNVSPAGGYTQVKFVNTGNLALSAIAFEVVPYAGGEPIMQTVKQPVVFGAKGNFKPGETNKLTSEKPVWPGHWKRVDCVHLVGLVLEYADGQTQKIGKAEIADYLRPQVAAQNCSNPSAPGPHN